MIKAIIFDFFGVVGQSTYQLVIEDLDLKDDQELQLTDLHKTYDNGFIDDEEFLNTYAQILCLDYQEFIKRYYESEARFTNSMAILNLIKELRNDYKVGLLSNVGIDGYHKFIEPLINNFDQVVTSYETKLAKPDVAIYEYTASRLGVDVSECVMIDDNITNCEGAETAGMQSILFNNFGQIKADIKNLLSN
jgi:HAD superfamily hydrolase (TIGR01509 family)